MGKVLPIRKKHYTNPLVFDTICNATAERQHEAVALSQKSDVMVIVGGRQSSNTAKLRDVCQQGCRTILIETADELSSGPFAGAKVVGLTAGASTPADIIKEVLSTMSEIVNNEVQENETPSHGGRGGRSRLGIPPLPSRPRRRPRGSCGSRTGSPCQIL